MSAHLTIRPGVSSGAPCVGRTGTPAWAIAGQIWAGDGLDDTARDFGLTRSEGLLACWFLATYGIEAAWWNGTKRQRSGSAWTKRWGKWASDYASEFWRHKYDLIPDPPTPCHCGELVTYGYDSDPRHHRGMCAHCDPIRCDAYPGECGR